MVREIVISQGWIGRTTFTNGTAVYRLPHSTYCTYHSILSLLETNADCSLFPSGWLQQQKEEGAGWLSVSEADVTWFIHIISSAHLVRRLSVGLNNVGAGKGLTGRWVVVTDTAGNKSTNEFHLHFKQAVARSRSVLYTSVILPRHTAYQRRHSAYSQTCSSSSERSDRVLFIG